MKVNPEMLFKLVREVVRDEMKKSLPGIVKEVITEQYLKKIVAEGVQPRRSPTVSSLQEIASEDEEQPRRISNVSVPRPKTSTSKLVAEDNPLAYLYEGVEPISRDGGVGPTDVDIDKLQDAGLDFAKMAETFKAMENRSSGAMQQTNSAKMREIEERRKALEVPASSYK